MNLNFLEICRERRGLTQEEVAVALGLGKQAYWKIEHGVVNLHPKHWKTLEQMLGVTESDLCDFTALVAVERRKKNASDVYAPHNKGLAAGRGSRIYGSTFIYGKRPPKNAKAEDDEGAPEEQLDDYTISVIEGFRRAVMDTVIDLEIDAATKDAVLKAIKNM